jgi:hypothetical protein
MVIIMMKAIIIMITFFSIVGTMLPLPSSLENGKGRV